MRKNFNKSNKSTKGHPYGRKSGKTKGAFEQTQNQANPSSSSYVAKSNDPSWYAHDPQLLKDAANISYNNPTGINLGVNTNYAHIYGDTIGNTADYLPGLWSMNINIGPGLSHDGNSAVNIAARNIYSFVRHANSGSSNYTAPDLMQYLIAMDSLYSVYNFMKRLYGVMNVYSTQNRYIPRALVQSMGFDPDEIYSRLADLRYQINAYTGRINSFYVPDTMPLMMRHSWLFSNVYSDSEGTKPQLYIFNPNGFYTYDETLESEQLQFKELTIKSGRYRTLDSLFTYVNEMIDALHYSESIGLMSGDIRKAYGEKLFVVSSVPEDYTVVPVYNPEVLMQIENSFAVGGKSAITLNWRDLGITSDPNSDNLLYDPKYKGSGDGHLGYKCNPVINMHKVAVNPEDTMVATRLRPTVYAESYDASTDTTNIVLQATGTEIVTHYTIWVFGTPSAGTVSIVPIDFSSVLYTGGAGTAPDGDDVTIMIHASKFDHHPILYCMSKGEDDSVYYTGVFGNIDNFAVASDNVFRKMHDTAVMSEFGIPYRA